MTQEPPAIAIVSCPFEADVRDPEALLARYHALSCWVRALVAAGAGAVTVIQRFHRDAHLRRDGADYRFVADGPSPGVPATYWGPRLVQAVKAARPAVVHVDGLIFPLLTRHLRLRLPADTAIVVQDHGGVHAGSPGFRRWPWRLLYRCGLRAADGFLFTARDLVAPWLGAAIISDGQPIHEVLESSTDLAESWIPTNGDAGGPRSGSPSLLWVGRLDTNKDPLTVLEGFEQVLAVHGGATLTMAFGTDDLLARVTQRIAGSAALSKSVRLLGRVPHHALPALYAAADFFVLASHHEGSGFSLLEALAFGVTPVVSDIPSFRMITDGGRIGALFPVEDGGKMASALLRLCSSDFMARRKQIRQYFLAALSWPSVGRDALAAYQSALLLRRQRHAP